VGGASQMSPASLQRKVSEVLGANSEKQKSRYLVTFYKINVPGH